MRRMKCVNGHLLSTAFPYRMAYNNNMQYELLADIYNRLVHNPLLTVKVTAPRDFILERLDLRRTRTP
jgi:hypothetical protein